MNVIRSRRSVRKYLDTPVEREKITQCLEAARLAPSACNAQPWKFIVVDDPVLKAELAGQAFSGLYTVTRFAAKAPVLIAIVSDPDWLPKAGGAVRKTDFHLTDIGIAGEHFVLRATDLGLGTCWLGWFDEKKAARTLGVPAGKRVEIMLSLGYPLSNEAGEVTRRKSLEEMSSFNGWRASR